MVNLVLARVLYDGLWLLIAFGWIVLIVVGLEVDKPLSGGIPGHISPEEERGDATQEGLWGRIGEVGGWVTFVSVCLSLPLILYWIFTTHPH
jgi:hypothetical protein